MSIYIKTDENGNITDCADWPFPESTQVDFDVVRGNDTKLYKSGTEPSLTLEEQLSALDARYQNKLQELKESFTSAMIIDGTPMGTNVALLRTKWAALIAAQQAEIDTLFSQE